MKFITHMSWGSSRAGQDIRGPDVKVPWEGSNMKLSVELMLDDDFLQ